MAVLNNASVHAEPPSNRWMTTAEAAEYLDVKPGTLEKWRFLKKGPRYYKIGSKQVRYRQSDLDAFLEGGTHD
jgi:excisionase family DNA binding protein